MTAIERQGHRKVTLRLRFVFVALVLGASCNRYDYEIAGDSGKPCRIHVGLAKTEVLDQCGVPDGLRFRPKVVEGFIWADTCSAPVYVYPNATVAFGCSGTVAQASVGTSEPLGINVAAITLQEEITVGANVEAAIVALARLEPRSDTTAELIARLEGSASPRTQAAVRKAQQIIAASP